MTYAHCDEYAHTTRRTTLFGGWSDYHRQRNALPHWVPEVRLADPHVGPRGDVLVNIFLRGGADGLSIVVPHGDDAYYDERPTLAVPRPDHGSQGKRAALDVDGFFGLHPALAPLMPALENGHLAAAHAVGSPDDSRSHFQAMTRMEQAAFGGGAYSGWLARHLATLDTGSDSALRAVAIGEMVPTALSGTRATAMTSLDAYTLHAPDEATRLLASLYASAEGPMAQAAQRTFDTLAALDLEGRTPYTTTPYPESDFGQAMRAVAELIHRDIGVEVASVDLGGWDTHAGQGTHEGHLSTLLTELAEGLAAFYTDMGPQMDGITVVIMSEFGRRVRENAAFGTDHGHGSVMMVMGGGLQGAQVIAEWPGLHPEQQTGPGDLRITTDYRHILAEITTRRLNNPRIDEIFPGFSAQPVDLVTPRT